MKQLTMLLRRMLPPFSLQHKELREAIPDDYESFCKIHTWFKDKPIPKSSVTIYYPGSADDMASVLMLCDALFGKKTKKISIIMLDIRDFSDGIIKQIKQFTKPWLVYHPPGEAKVIEALYRDRTIRISFYIRDAERLPPELKGGIDIYYERAFEIFRSNTTALTQVLRHMKPYGLIMSDYGFPRIKGFKRLKGIPQKLGLYEKFQILQRVPQ